MNQKIRQTILETFNNEAAAIEQLKHIVNDEFVEIVRTLYETKGKVIVTGLGKSALIAKKISATFNSTGTTATFLHTGDALHGDVGVVDKDDIIIIVSKSGNTPELEILLPLLKDNSNTTVAITNNENSYLTENATYKIIALIEKEACPINLAPTTSSTVQLVIGDAIANALLNMRGFNSADFLKVHPAGSLGKKLYLRVNELVQQNACPYVIEQDNIKKVIIEISSGMLGAVAVVDENKNIKGIITDGDLRRMLNKGLQVDDTVASLIMSKNPKTIDINVLAIEAFEIMKQNKISQLLVTENNILHGIIHLQDILKKGIV